MKNARAQLALTTAAICAIGAANLGGPASADDFSNRLFGRAPGKGPTYACFQRVYDEAHLQSHPQQNVRAMLVLAKFDSESPESYDLRIGSYFRKLGSRLDTAGSCSSAVAQDDETGRKTIHCGVDCDGGKIDVALKDDGSILVSIPDGARLWKPGSEDTHIHGAFGPDDKLFRVDRAKTAECLPLAADAAERRDIAWVK
jgi:hypothetical protein